MTTAVMRLEIKILCGKKFQTMSVWVTFTQGHSDKGWCKILENTVIFLDTIITTIMKASTMVVYSKGFQGMPVPVTFVQGHKSWQKILEIL